MNEIKFIVYSVCSIVSAYIYDVTEFEGFNGLSILFLIFMVLTVFNIILDWVHSVIEFFRWYKKNKDKTYDELRKNNR